MHISVPTGKPEKWPEQRLFYFYYDYFICNHRQKWSGTIPFSIWFWGLSPASVPGLQGPGARWSLPQSPTTGWRERSPQRALEGPIKCLNHWSLPVSLPPSPAFLVRVWVSDCDHFSGRKWGETLNSRPHGLFCRVEGVPDVLICIVASILPVCKPFLKRWSCLQTHSLGSLAFTCGCEDRAAQVRRIPHPLGGRGRAQSQ